MNDFIQRRGIAGKPRWALTGDESSFLSTELVPLQIILQHYQHAILSSEDIEKDVWSVRVIRPRIAVSVTAVR